MNITTFKNALAYIAIIIIVLFSFRACLTVHEYEQSKQNERIDRFVSQNASKAVKGE